MHNATLIFRATRFYLIAIKKKAFEDDEFAVKQEKFYGALMRAAMLLYGKNAGFRRA